MHGIIETMSNLTFIETAHRELVFSTKHLNISKTTGQALSAVEQYSQSSITANVPFCEIW